MSDQLTVPDDTFDAEPDPTHPLQVWRRATAALHAAEERRAPHAEQLALSAEVIRARNTLALHRLAGGVRLPDQVVRDERLLAEADDADLP